MTAMSVSESSPESGLEAEVGPDLSSDLMIMSEEEPRACWEAVAESESLDDD
jgi:hypothetical protein